ncbi:MAG TPA: APC family permease, partial [Clostridia bacterium]|nr:APC family permease [Clostridia bacterium]
MFQKLKSLLVGRALESAQMEHEKFSVLWGLPILSSDAISSVSYACEEILMVLVPMIGLAAYKPLLWVAAAIILLLFILVFSYRQTIDNYPNGGGSYSVASDNLGRIPGLVAAASLSIDYVLTVAVSASSGVAAIVSAFPELLPYRVALALVIIALLTLGNLRGIRESSVLFGVPTYLFMITILAMIFAGLFKVLVWGYVPEEAVAAAAGGLPLGELTLVLFLKAFSSGCTALTGVEAVSNGIPNFRHPSQKHAKQVLTLLALIVLTIFGGVCALASVYKIAPAENVTVMAQIAQRVFGAGSVMFYAVQATTAVILIMAANTAFADLPLLLSLLGRDGYMARQFSSRGARLSFSNGIILLFLVASALVALFHGETHRLIPLYAVGVFLSFTLSQAGMFKRWITRREGAWKHKALINGFGTAVTAATCVIIAVSKFTHGAWMVIVCIPLL